MEAQVEILVVGTHETIVATILRLLNQMDGWHATGVSDPAAVLDACGASRKHVVLLGAGLSEDEEQTIARELETQYPEIKLVWHYGGGSGLLYAEIYQALQA